MDLHTIKTPSLVLDVERVRRNAARMSARAREFGVTLRPHVKTHKCVEVARMQTFGGAGGITVSTLAEARAFVAHGFKDITYAVPVEPGKFDEALELAKLCERFALITDDVGVTRRLDEAARRAGVVLDLFLKVDCGYHRCGVEPDSLEALEIPRLISDARGLRFAGILTHVGHSYHAHSREELLGIARQERDLMREFAARLRAEGIEVPTVSVGSTPTVTHVEHLDGVDEARPGNYIFFDAFQATLGSCGFDDCALTVLASVVHRDRTRRKLVLDAGAIALSKDRGPLELDPACGFGRLLDVEGVETGLRVGSLSQEHGEVFVEDEGLLESFGVGTRARVLANHSCLTAAQHSHYHVLEGGRIVDRWEIQRGW
ncbi:MAG TPA: alanine racemase [Pyrinomonadaceae bacterium]|jgi:D-serine deaminase-like pyridoxal phosphate-dependent protein|nr:alanine racemase [Pyrinomonadaceae bacterium]